MSLLGVVTPAVVLDCRDRALHWSDGTTPLNRLHVSCGEIGNGRPKGFHSTRLQDTSALVMGIAARSNQRDGIYDATVSFRNGARKFSTFFPDSCTVDRIVASIRHAASHAERDHPQWGKVGPSAPAENDEGYCRDANGDPFQIRIGAPADGRVNTAFPN